MAKRKHLILRITYDSDSQPIATVYLDSTVLFDCIFLPVFKITKLYKGFKEMTKGDRYLIVKQIKNINIPEKYAEFHKKQITYTISITWQ